MADDMKVFERTLVRNGWTADVNGNGHRKLTSPDGAVVTASMTPNNVFRTIQNTVRELRALGYDEQGKKIPNFEEHLAELATKADEAEERQRANEAREERRLAERLAQSVAAEGEQVPFWKRYGGKPMHEPKGDLEAQQELLDTPLTENQEKLLEAVQREEAPTAETIDLLKHPMLQYTVIEGEPPPSAKPDMRDLQPLSTEARARNRAAKAQEAANVTPAMDMPVLGRPGSRGALTDDFSVEALLAGVKKETPLSALGKLWRDVMDGLPDTDWYKLPGQVKGHRRGALDGVCQSSRKYEVQYEGNTAYVRRTR